MGSELSIGIDLLLAVFTLLYIVRLLFSSFGESTLSGGTGRLRREVLASTKRSLLNQHVKPRIVRGASL